MAPGPRYNPPTTEESATGEPQDPAAFIPSYWVDTSPEQPDTQRPEEQEEDLYSDITEVEYDYDEELYDEDESEAEARAVPTDPLGT